MRNWDYKIKDVGSSFFSNPMDSSTLEEILGGLGEDGWELAWIEPIEPNVYRCIFKRPRQ